MEETVRSALLNPGTAVFARPFVGAEAGNLVLVCGTVSADIGGRRFDNVPFIVIIDYQRVTSIGVNRDATASLARLGDGPGFEGPYSDSVGNVVSFCRVEAGVILPVSQTAGEAATTPRPPPAPVPF